MTTTTTTTTFAANVARVDMTALEVGDVVEYDNGERVHVTGEPFTLLGTTLRLATITARWGRPRLGGITITPGYSVLVVGQYC